MKIKRFVDLYIKTIDYKKVVLKVAVLALIVLGILITNNEIRNNLNNYVAFASSSESIYSVHNQTNLILREGDDYTAKAIQNINTYVEYIDSRAFVLNQYFLANDSPLYGTGEIFVNACDKYNAPSECITVAAIAKNETNLCKYYNSAKMYNCWGFGGAGTNRQAFDDFEQSIDRVTDVLVNQYGNIYMNDPSLMEQTFCGVSRECVGWGAKIKMFMREIDSFSVSQGFGKMER